MLPALPGIGGSPSSSSGAPSRARPDRPRLQLAGTDGAEDGVTSEDWGTETACSQSHGLYKALEAYAAINTADCLPVLSNIEPGTRERPAIGAVIPELAATHEEEGEEKSPRSVASSFRRSFAIVPPARPASARPRRQRPAVPRENSADVIRRVLEASRWHVVDCPPKGSRRDEEPAEETLRGIEEDSKGIVVLTEFDTQSWALRLIHEIVSSESGLLIVVVVMDSLSTNAGMAEVDLMLDLQRRFQDAGVDDVVVKGSGSEEQLRLSVAMGIQRAQRRGSDHEAINHFIEQQDEQAVSSANMFWSCVHRIFAGFPKIDPHAPEIASSAPAPGQMVGRTRLGAVLGEGAFGRVYAGRNKETGAEEAVKVVAKSSLCKLHKVCTIWREFSLLTKLQHDNIVRLCSITHAPHSIAIHMELVGKMSLYGYIKEQGGSLEMPVVYDIGAQVASALAHCHGLGIAHRDVKHENVVVADAQGGAATPHAKLVDFGLALDVRAVDSDHRCGTMPYCPPEMLRGVKDGQTVSTGEAPMDPRGADVWSLGVVLLEMACGLGSMCKMLGWGECPAPSDERGEELKRFFSQKGAIAGGLRKLLQDNPARLKGVLNDRFLQLLAGQLEVDASARWGMQAVTEHFGQGPAPRCPSRSGSEKQQEKVSESVAARHLSLGSSNSAPQPQRPRTQEPSRIKGAAGRAVHAFGQLLTPRSGRARPTELNGSAPGDAEGGRQTAPRSPSQARDAP